MSAEAAHDDTAPASPSTLRRGRAAELFEAGVPQADVARAVGVTRQTVSRWHAIWRDGGEAGLGTVRPRGPRSRLTDDDVRRVGAALAEGPNAYGFPDQHWTCRQVGWVVSRLTGVSFHPAHVGRLIRRHGWPVNPPFTT